MKGGLSWIFTVDICGLLLDYIVDYCGYVRERFQKEIKRQGSREGDQAQVKCHCHPITSEPEEENNELWGDFQIDMAPSTSSEENASDPVQVQESTAEDTEIDVAANSDEDDVSTTPTSGKKKSRIIPYNFSDEQENDLVEWFRGHECLYNKKLKDFKNVTLKNRIYEEKVASLTPHCTCKLNYIVICFHVVDIYTAVV